MLAFALLALSQETVVTLNLDRDALAQGQHATFTIQLTPAFQPARWRILGFMSGRDQALKYDGQPSGPETTPDVTRLHVGQTFAMHLGVFEYGSASWRAETDAVEGQINQKLLLRRSLAEQLDEKAAQVNAADDQALAALKAARDQVRAIVAAGEPGAEDAADNAIQAGWAAADAAWAGAQVAIEEWRDLLDQIADIELQISLIIEAGRTYYANAVFADAQALEVTFLDEETATCKTVHKVRRELMFVRPQGAHTRVDLDALPAGRVAVTKKDVVQRAANKADVVTLELEGLATLSGAVKDVEIRALVNSEKIKSMPHTNVEYRNLRLTRQPDVDDSNDDFAYDDAKLQVPDRHLLAYARGTIFPPVSRYAAQRNLANHLRIDIPVVDDSHGAADFVKPKPRRPLNKTDKKFATIEFAESKPQAAIVADRPLLAVYDGGASGAFLTVLGYDGLPRESKEFGKKVVKVIAVSIDNASAELKRFDVEYFFTFRRKTRPTVAGQPPNSAGCANGLWYFSAEGAGEPPAVPGYSWANLTVGGAVYPILHGDLKDGAPGTLGETTAPPMAKTIRLFGAELANASASENGFGYTFNKTTTVTRVVDGRVKKVKVTLKMTVEEKRFSSLVAHVWRHERRHAEQIEDLAKAGPGDTTDQDGDHVYNDLEVANNTDIADDATWKTLKFPISPTTGNHDQEVDCELRSVAERGVDAKDWAMDTREAGRNGRAQDRIREGIQWSE